jgi:hypothetical protein
MKVKLLSNRVVGYGNLQRRGLTVEVTPEEALRLIKDGQAEALTETIETAMEEPREELRGRTRSNRHATSVK